MTFIVFLAVLFLAFFAFTSIMSVIFYTVDGHWPFWHFKAFIAWWWPLRKASAATMLADTIIGELHKDWRKSGYKDWVNDKLRATVTTFCSEVKATVNGKSVPLNQWDKFRIFEAIKAFEKGIVGKRKSESAQEVAEAIIKAYGDRS